MEVDKITKEMESSDGYSEGAAYTTKRSYWNITWCQAPQNYRTGASSLTAPYAYPSMFVHLHTFI